MAEEEKEETQEREEPTEEKQKGQQEKEVSLAPDFEFKLVSQVSKLIAEQTDRGIKDILRGLAQEAGKLLGCTITIKWPGEKEFVRRNCVPVEAPSLSSRESLDHPNEDEMSGAMEKFGKTLGELTTEDFHEIVIEGNKKTKYKAICETCGWESDLFRSKLDVRFYGLCHSYGRYKSLNTLSGRSIILSRIKEILLGGINMDSEDD